jgi:hypothetical protein
VIFKISLIFLKACITNILVLAGQQHQYIGAIQGESKVNSTTPIRFKASIQSAEVQRKQKFMFSRRRPVSENKERRSPQ